VVDAQRHAVLVPQEVVEVCSEASFITFTARSCKEFFAIGLQLQHQGLRVLMRSDHVDIHDLESQLFHAPVVHRRVEVGQRHERPVSILSVEVNLRFNYNAGSFCGQLQQNHVQVAVGDTGEHYPRWNKAVIDNKDRSETVVDTEERRLQLAAEPFPHGTLVWFTPV
jgi:hypothetical protein